MHIQNLIKFYKFIPQRLIRNEILILIKGHNDYYSVKNQQTIMYNGPYLDFIKINAYSKFDHSPSVFLKILSRNDFFTSTKGHISLKFKSLDHEI